MTDEVSDAGGSQRPSGSQDPSSVQATRALLAAVEELRSLWPQMSPQARRRVLELARELSGLEET